MSGYKNPSMREPERPARRKKAGSSAALLSVHYMFRFMPRLTWYALPAVFLMIFATLYLRYHYAADILAGGMLAALCALLAPRLIGYQRPTSWGPR